MIEVGKEQGIKMDPHLVTLVTSFIIMTALLKPSITRARPNLTINRAPCLRHTSDLLCCQPPCQGRLRGWGRRERGRGGKAGRGAHRGAISSFVN